MSKDIKLKPCPLISLDDIKNIINEEITEINDMQPENSENEITVEVMKMHYKVECKVIMSRITKFINEHGRSNNG